MLRTLNITKRNNIYLILILLSFLPTYPTLDKIETGEWEYYELDYTCITENYDTVIITEDKQYYEAFDTLCFYVRFNFVNNKAITKDFIYNAPLYLFRINDKHFWGYIQYQDGVSYVEFKKI